VCPCASIDIVVLPLPLVKSRPAGRHPPSEILQALHCQVCSGLYTTSVLVPLTFWLQTDIDDDRTQLRRYSAQRYESQRVCGFVHSIPEGCHESDCAETCGSMSRTTIWVPACKRHRDQRADVTLEFLPCRTQYWARTAVDAVADFVLWNPLMTLRRTRCAPRHSCSTLRGADMFRASHRVQHCDSVCAWGQHAQRSQPHVVPLLAHKLERPSGNGKLCLSQAASA
jgi:hypothetical protein